ncbi:hypothetical protein C8R46DRAFT_68804 [Mycena filopes]|nr:hypothetical protein C8R46DRAFT_68804 [Mycena filopes]
MHASLRLSNTSKLADPSLKTLALSAATGSLEDLAKLHSLIPDTPLAQLRFLIPVFYANLKTDDISSLRCQLDSQFSDDGRNCVSRAMFALKGLSELEEHLVSRACSEIWPSAWTWIQFLNDCDKRPGATTISSSELELAYLIISDLCKDSQTLSTITATPGVRAYIVKGWNAAVEHLQFRERRFRNLTEFLLHNVNAKDLQELVQGAGGTANLAFIMVKYMRCAIPHKDHTVETHDVGALLFTCTFLQKIGLMDGPLTNSLLTNGIIECATIALCALLASPVMEPLTDLSIPLSIGVIITHISTFPGFPWVAEALKAGLLRAIVLCVSRRMPIIAVPLDFLFENLFGSLVYHSVLSHLGPALDDAQDLANTPEFRASPFVRRWDNFVALAMERLTVLERYNSGELGKLRACDNLKCGVMRKDPSLLGCAACNNAFYCSQDCQAADWKAEHRKLCPAAANRPHENCPDLTFLNRDFLRALLHHDYEANRPKILGLQVAFLRRNAFGTSCIKFDYRNGCAEIEIIPGGTPGSGPPGAAEYALRAARGGGRIELHVMVVDEGRQRARGHLISLRSVDGSVPEQLKGIAASGQVVSPALFKTMGLLDSASEAGRTH